MEDLELAERYKRETEIDRRRLSIYLMVDYGFDCRYLIIPEKIPFKHSNPSAVFVMGVRRNGNKKISESNFLKQLVVIYTNIRCFNSSKKTSIVISNNNYRKRVEELFPPEKIKLKAI